MSILKEICTKKSEHVAKKKSETSLSTLEESAKSAPPPRGFLKALQYANGPALIAEVKKASPSKGLIREDFNPADIAKIYEAKGAHCISVLTDEPYFQGHDEYLTAVKNAVSTPILRKDFMVDPYQITESRALGADCILLIMAALSDSQAKELYDLAESYKMDVLVEIHDKDELDRAALLAPAMIGVNNRNLKTLGVDVATSHALLPHIPQNALRIAESGLADAQTIQSLHDAGYNAFLIGESIMRHPDISVKIDELFPTPLK